jgi:hypothetical protein
LILMLTVVRTSLSPHLMIMAWLSHQSRLCKQCAAHEDEGGITYLRSWALLEKLPIVQPRKNSIFYETWRFITVLTRALRWSLSWARLIQSIPSHPVSLKIYFNIVHPPISWSS